MTDAFDNSQPIDPTANLLTLSPKSIADVSRDVSLSARERAA